MSEFALSDRAKIVLDAIARAVANDQHAAVSAELLAQLADIPSEQLADWSTPEAQRVVAHYLDERLHLYGNGLRWRWIEPIVFGTLGESEPVGIAFYGAVCMPMAEQLPIGPLDYIDDQLMLRMYAIRIADEENTVIERRPITELSSQLLALRRSVEGGEEEAEEEEER